MAPDLYRFFAITVLAFLLASPAFAGTKYMSGSPALSVSIAGTNEFSPGDDVIIPLVIQNTGLNEFKFVQSSIVDRDDLPNTAKLLQVTLLPGDAPLVIKSDPQMLGDLKGGSTITSSFSARINRTAPAGTYLLPVSVRYTYLEVAEQYSVDSIKYYYNTHNETLFLPVRIKADLSIDILSAKPEHLNIGTEGYVNFTIRNAGSDYGKKAIVRIERNGDSPVIPLDSSVYIGDFAPGSVAGCRYKVSVAPGAERSTYPVDISIVYEDSHGEMITSRRETVGIPVGGKISFAIVSPPTAIAPGHKRPIRIEYRNTGDTQVYSAQARISAVDPFTSNDDIAYLGTMEPGQTVTASYEISVDRDATEKEYGLDTEIRYRDALDNTYISDIMKARINVTAQTGLAAVLASPVLLSVIGAAVVGIIYGIYRYRKRAT